MNKIVKGMIAMGFALGMANSAFSAEALKLGYLVKQPEEPWFQTEWNFADKAGKDLGFEVIKIAVPDGEKTLNAIDSLAANGAKTVPVMMPYVTSFFMPRRAGDRPDVVPAGAVNFAFIGQFAETTRDCIFTTEYSVRTGMEAAYQLLGIERGVPEVFNSTYDIRKLISATVHLRDGKELDLPVPEILRKRLIGKITDNEVGALLAEYELIKN